MLDKAVVDLICELGEEAGEYEPGMNREEFAEEVISNSNIPRYPDALTAFRAAADGDVKALLAIRDAWGLRPIV